MNRFFQPFTFRPVTIAAVSALALFTGISAEAATITTGFTYAVASGGSYGTTGTHFHSSTGGDFGNPAGKAEVGNFFDENVRGLSEYDLTALVTGPAFVSFNVFMEGGLFPGGNDTPFTGVINVYSYEGNNAEDISDFEAVPATLVGSFSTAGLSVGDTLSFDISAQYNAAITADWDSLGIRLQVDTGSPAGNTGGSQAYTFDSFRLTSTDESSSPVPDSGSTLLLFGLMLPVAGFFRKRLAKIVISSR